MIKGIIRATQGRIVQFNFIDGIDGPQTRALAASLGLKTNGSISKIWEANFHGSWHIVNDGDYVILEYMQIA